MQLSKRMSRGQIKNKLVKRSKQKLRVKPSIIALAKARMRDT
jgi:hypothetical protein